MQAKLENAATALADPGNLTAEQCNAFISLLGRRREELRALKEEIKSPHRENGVEDRWARTLATGSNEDLEHLQAEYDAIERGLERVSAQYAQFWNLQTVCRQREAAEALPARISSLNAKANAVMKARAALEKSMSELEAAYHAATETYRYAGDDSEPRATEKLVEKVIESAKCAAYTPTGAVYHAATVRPHRIAEGLRYAEPQGVMEPARPWREMARA